MSNDVVSCQWLVAIKVFEACYDTLYKAIREGVRVLLIQSMNITASSYMEYLTCNISYDIDEYTTGYRGVL